MDEKRLAAHNRRMSRIVFLVCVLFSVALYLVLSAGGGNIEIMYDDENFALLIYEYKWFSHAEGTPVQIFIKDIESMEVREDLDRGERVDGIESTRVAFGTWENDEFGRYRLCVSKRTDECVVFTLSGGAHIAVSSTTYTADFICETVTELIS